MTTPMIENIDSVEPNIISASTTPISVSGSDGHQRQRLQESS